MHDPFDWSGWKQTTRDRAPVGRWWFVAAIVALSLGWFRAIPFVERVELNLVLTGPPSRTRLLEPFLDLFSDMPGVAEATVEPFEEGETCESFLARRLADADQQPEMFLLVDPVGGDDPRRASRLGVAARRRGKSIVAVVERTGSAPGVSIVLPSRWASVSPGPDASRGNGAVVMASLTGLSRLADPVELIFRGPLPDAWNAEVVRTQLASQVAKKVERLADGSVVATLSDAIRQGDSALLYLDAGRELVAAGSPWLEIELRSGAEVVAVDRWSPIVRPPKVLYVPLHAALRHEPRVASTLPQVESRQAESSHRGLPWHLLLRAGSPDSPPGLTMVWPHDHSPAYDPAYMQQLVDAGAVVRSLPDHETLTTKAFCAVVIDASLPLGLTSERSRDGKHRFVAGGLPNDGLYTASEVDAFTEALRGYLNEGGTLVLVGANVFAWEKTDDNQNLRALLEKIEPRLADFRAVEPRRRWSLGVDDTESASSHEKASLGSLPPMVTDVAPRLELPPGLSATERETELKHRSLQYWLQTGRPHPWEQGDVPPTRRGLAEAYFRDRTSSGAAANDAEAVAIVAPDLLLDTPTELAFAAVGHLRALYGHPEIMMEVNGEPAFLRFEPRDKSPEGEPAEWVSAHPFMGDPREQRRLFASVLERPDAPWDLRPTKAKKQAAAVEWASFRDYWSMQGTWRPHPHDLRWGFFDATDLGEAGRMTNWRLIDTTGKDAPLTEELLPSRPLASDLTRRVFFFDASSSPTPAEPPRDAGKPSMVQMIDLRPTGAAYWRRFLHHGRLRWLRLLELQAAQDLAVMRGDVTDGAIPALRAAGASPEAIDLFRRLSRVELRLACATPYEPTSPQWTRLASTSNNATVLSVASAGNGGHGRVVLALVEPALDQSLDERLRTPLKGWFDFTSLMTPASSSGPGTLLDMGFHLVVNGDDWQVTAHDRIADSWPPVTSATPVGFHGPARLRLLDDNGAEQFSVRTTVSTTTDEPWIAPVKQFANDSALSSDAKMLEIEFQLPGGETTSLFAPLPASYLAAVPRADMGDEPPTVHLIQCLLDMYARRQTWTVERLPGRRTLRVYRTASVESLDDETRPPSNVRIHLVNDEELSTDQWSFEDVSPGQWLIRFPATTSWNSKTLKVVIGDESHFVDGFASDEPERPLRWGLSHASVRTPSPESCMLDSLVAPVGPHDAPGSEPLDTLDASARRGLIETAFDGSDETRTRVEEFVARAVRMRTETTTSRPWYLIALGFVAIGTAARARVNARD